MNRDATCARVVWVLLLGHLFLSVASAQTSTGFAFQNNTGSTISSASLYTDCGDCSSGGSYRGSTDIPPGYSTFGWVFCTGGKARIGGHPDWCVTETLGTWNTITIGPAPPTYYYCDYNLNWTNAGAGMQTLGLFQDGSQIPFDFTYLLPNQNLGPNFDIRWLQETANVSPNTGFNYKYRFSKGTNNAVPCPTLELRNMLNPWDYVRDYGTPGSASTNSPTGTSGGSGGGAGSGNAGVGTTNGPAGTGTSTNSAGGPSATSGDINRLGDAFLAGLAQLAKILSTKAEEATLEGFSNQVGQANTALRGLMETVTNELGAALADLAVATNELGMLTTVTNELAFLTNQAAYLTNANYNAVGEPQRNASAAWSSGTGAVATASSLYDSASTEIGSAPTVGSGSGSAFSFSFCGQTINLDPEVRLPGVMSFIRSGWTFVLTLAFTIAVGRLLMQSAVGLAGSQTGGVPNLTILAAGFGGNLQGVILGIAVSGAVIALWVTFWTWFFGQILTHIGLGASATTFLNMGGNGLALYLLNEAFPVAFGLSLLWTYIGILFGASKLILFCAAASRILLGK